MRTKVRLISLSSTNSTRVPASRPVLVSVADTCPTVCAAALSRGSVKVKVLPWSKVLSNVRVPLNCFTRAKAMLSPKPVPLYWWLVPA